MVRVVQEPKEKYAVGESICIPWPAHPEALKYFWDAYYRTQQASAVVELINQFSCVSESIWGSGAFYNVHVRDQVIYDAANVAPGKMGQWKGSVPIYHCLDGSVFVAHDERGIGFHSPGADDVDPVMAGLEDFIDRYIEIITAGDCLDVRTVE